MSKPFASSSSAQSSIDEIRKLTAELLANPDKSSELTMEQLVEIRKSINPYGSVIQAETMFANVSVINFKDERLRKLHTTAIIGYLYRLLDEYVPPEVELEEHAHAKRVAKMTDKEEITSCTKSKNESVKLYTETARAIAKKFLDRNFSFDLDRHIRGGHTQGGAEELEKDIAMARKMPVQNMDDAINAIAPAYTHTFGAKKETLAILECLANDDMDVGDKITALTKHYYKLEACEESLGAIAGPEMVLQTTGAVLVEPPQDVFYHFNRYLTNNYERLREITSAVYCEREDIELAIIFYDAFKTESLAREWLVKHEAVLKTAAFTVSNAGVTLLGPFKENRDKIDFYNANTDIIKKMMDQCQSDSKLGADLLQKCAGRQKAKNISEIGRDPVALDDFVKNMSIINELGIKKVLTSAQQDELLEATRLKEQHEVPDDSIAVDIFHTNEKGVMQRKQVYTQAEEPHHLTKDSEYQKEEKYQPVRTTLPAATTKKTIRSRSGTKKTINVPAKKAS